MALPKLETVSTPFISWSAANFAQKRVIASKVLTVVLTIACLAAATLFVARKALLILSEGQPTMIDLSKACKLGITLGLGISTLVCTVVSINQFIDALLNKEPNVCFQYTQNNFGDMKLYLRNVFLVTLASSFVGIGVVNLSAISSQ